MTAAFMPARIYIVTTVLWSLESYHPKSESLQLKPLLARELVELNYSIKFNYKYIKRFIHLGPIIVARQFLRTSWKVSLAAPFLLFDKHIPFGHLRIVCRTVPTSRAQKGSQSAEAPALFTKTVSWSLPTYVRWHRVSTIRSVTIAGLSGR